MGTTEPSTAWSAVARATGEVGSLIRPASEDEIAKAEKHLEEIYATWNPFDEESARDIATIQRGLELVIGDPDRIAAAIAAGNRHP